MEGWCGQVKRVKSSKWKFLSSHPKDVAGEILKLRQIKDKTSFLNPDYKDLSSPYDIPGLKKACELITKVLKEGEPIGIFADYDADGICGGAILYRALKELGAKVYYYVPTREEGYGLNKTAVESFKKSAVKLFICVDCGIRDVEEIKYAKKLGLKAIVADHHLKADVLPPAEAIIYPKSAKEDASFYNLSGGGIAYMLAKALLGKSQKEKWLIDLAAVATIADIVPLLGDNRIISKFGLVVLNKTKNLGLKFLIKEAQLESRELGTYEIGFMIAPRINAAGRISEPIKGFNLLVEGDSEEAKLVAKELDILNTQRQEILGQTTEEAFEQVEKKKLYQNKAIVVVKKGWNDGVVGLVAGKIVDKYWRPAIVLSQTDSLLRGSARSIPGVNISELIGSCAKHVLSFGGHTQAAGLSLEAKKYDAFERGILENASKLDDKLYERELIVDVLLDISQVNLSLAEELEKFEPFGQDNPRPTFALKNVEIVGLRNVGKELAHVKAEICKDNHKCSIIGFNFERNGWDLKQGKKYDVAFSIKVDRWEGKKKVDLVLVDARAAV